MIFIDLKSFMRILYWVNKMIIINVKGFIYIVKYIEFINDYYWVEEF